MKVDDESRIVVGMNTDIIFAIYSALNQRYCLICYTLYSTLLFPFCVRGHNFTRSFSGLEAPPLSLSCDKSITYIAINLELYLSASNIA